MPVRAIRNWGRPLKATVYVAKVRDQYGPLAQRILAEYPAASDEEAARSKGAS
jgi:hypothetical protein